jgi:hypothetical protein
MDAIAVTLSTTGTVPVHVVGESQKGQKLKLEGTGADGALTLRAAPLTNAPTKAG